MENMQKDQETFNDFTLISFFLFVLFFMRIYWKIHWYGIEWFQATLDSTIPSLPFHHPISRFSSRSLNQEYTTS